MEEWRAVVGYEGFYEVSSMGNVRSIDREIIDNNGHVKRYKGRETKKSVLRSGYVRVHLIKDGIDKTKHVHRLVAEAFLENADELREVNHINELKHDNRVDNLEWCTPSYNQNYGTINTRRKDAYMRNGRSRAVMLFDSKCIRIFRNAKEAAEITNTSINEIRNSCYSSISSHGKWVFLDTYLMRMLPQL